MNADHLFSKFSDCQYDLGLGEPVLLQQLLQVEPALFPVPTGPLNLRYPALGGHPKLVEQIEALYPGHHVVVANGARQALAALFWAYRWNSDDSNSRRSVSAAAPYYPGFRSLADGSKMSFTSQPFDTMIRDYYVNVVTAPGNPHGDVWNDFGAKVDVWDACYASPVYGWFDHNENFSWEVKVESSSKMFGTSGLRVGWLVTKNKKLADDAALYIERTTSGVCNASQLQVAYLLKNRDYVNEAFHVARGAMGQNYERLYNELGKYCMEFSLSPRRGGMGMFAWFQIEDQYQLKFDLAMQKSGVRFFPGHLFGEHRPGYFRASLGQDMLQTALAMEELRSALR